MCGLVEQVTTPAGESILPKGMLHCGIRRMDESEFDFGFVEQGRSTSHEMGRKPEVKPWKAPVYAGMFSPFEAAHLVVVISRVYARDILLTLKVELSWP